MFSGLHSNSSLLDPGKVIMRRCQCRFVKNSYHIHMYFIVYVINFIGKISVAEFPNCALYCYPGVCTVCCCVCRWSSAPPPRHFQILETSQGVMAQNSIFEFGTQQRTVFFFFTNITPKQNFRLKFTSSLKP